MNTHLNLHTVWRVIDSHWTCVNITNFPLSLPDYLNSLGFEVPACIKYCLAESCTHRLKFRQHGGVINIYVSLKN